MGNADKLYKHLNKEKRLKLSKTTNQNLFHNKLGYLIDSTGDVIGLNLSRQRIRDISFLKDYNTIQFLDLSHNMVFDISILSQLKNLVRLDISYNEISDITCLRELKMLKWVKIEKNNISTIPQDIMDWDFEIISDNKLLIDLIPLKKSQSSTAPNRDFTIYDSTNLEIPNTKTNGNIGFEEEEFDPFPLEKMIVKKILVVAANPIHMDKTRFDEEMRDIDRALKETKNRHKFEFRIANALRRRDLQLELVEYEPNIVHFIGHGTKEGLIVVDVNGLAVLFPFGPLSELFKLCSKHVNCVFLNCCYSAIEAQEIGKHIDSAIGMKNAIQDKAAIEFSVGFYVALGAGKSINDAFNFGKVAIATHFPNENEHLIPALFVR